ncbi:uncharacterized protein SPPG_08460 [Spizellomyces punctatus DAOM BR117]|uniref:Uncharacterized protein n=1 Tax=Spizellomyces punctatus (strain DAOM BR117) TaxID=645134 RepID=A0A0L0H5U6_SPIPD|nr:uncharacterized protein SPPG_08460 [Spizellomyces punctatus DAOM BR117]KNC96068.1 hypothetical protein SPPG_08460 [Spizellomyces punctatus DAOM BR117]|eukprot:XP_016604108.1 hypothetical protein SPPG_08460 [Spizellomyces punctatus DAOM BR117]
MTLIDELTTAVRTSLKSTNLVEDAVHQTCREKFHLIHVGDISVPSASYNTLYDLLFAHYDHLFKLTTGRAQNGKRRKEPDVQPDPGTRSKKRQRTTEQRGGQSSAGRGTEEFAIPHQQTPVQYDANPPLLSSKKITDANMDFLARGTNNNSNGERSGHRPSIIGTI